MRKVLIIAIALLSVSCHTQKRIVQDTEAQSQTTDLRKIAQVSLSFDSLLQSIDFSADSVIIDITPTVPKDTTRSAGELGKPNTPTVRITAHKPRVRTTKEKKNLSLVQTVEQDSATSQTQANSHADTSKESIGVARPMNGTLVIVLLAVLLIVAVVLLLYLHKRKII